MTGVLLAIAVGGAIFLMLTKHQPCMEFNTKEAVYSVKFSPDGTVLAIGESSGLLRLQSLSNDMANIF